jgi:hypothetical protein
MELKPSGEARSPAASHRRWSHAMVVRAPIRFKPLRLQLLALRTAARGRQAARGRPPLESLRDAPIICC